MLFYLSHSSADSDDQIRNHDYPYDYTDQQVEREREEIHSAAENRTLIRECYGELGSVWSQQEFFRPEGYR